MKTIIGILIVIIGTSFSLEAQNTKCLAKGRIGNLDCSIEQTINASIGDTEMSVTIKFNNTGYKSDIRVITFDVQEDTADISHFARDLKGAAAVGTNTVQVWDEYEYTLKVFDFSDKVYLFESAKKGDGHIELTKMEALKLMGWVSSAIRICNRYRHAATHTKTSSIDR